jgi:copper chaperone NosL
MKPISKLSKLLIALSSLSIVACYFLPLWEIRLWAPQYPEGLAMQIWHNTLSGDVDVINGLNHYIGMRHIKVEMFPEFAFLKYVIGAFMAFGFFVAWKGTLRWLQIYVLCIILAGIIALADFYRWGYDYGHNLDPTAPIQIPDMSYQPPVIGYKVLLNFTALSLPASGGWIFVGVGAIAFGLLIWEMGKQQIGKKLYASFSAILTISLLTSCSVEPEPFNYGKDNCHLCKMMLMDSKFGAEILTKKGKIYKFDDVNCLTNFLDSKEIQEEGIKNIYFADFAKPNTLVGKENAYFLQSEEIKSPMSSGIAVFSSKEDLEKNREIFNGKALNWNELSERIFEVHQH